MWDRGLSSIKHLVSGSTGEGGRSICPLFSPLFVDFFWSVQPEPAPLTADSPKNVSLNSCPKLLFRPPSLKSAGLRDSGTVSSPRRPFISRIHRERPTFIIEKQACTICSEAPPRRLKADFPFRSDPPSR